MIKAFPILLGIAALAVTACNGGTEKQASQPAEPTAAAVVVPAFNADSAYSFVKAQVDFGPRVPNSKEHRACGDYLAAKLKEYGAEVINQEAELVAYDGTRLNARNIIAQFQPEKKGRIMLCAHWDSRPWADSDPDASKHRTPILGANDGASGVGVLMEIARALSTTPTELGIDIILFDAEDYGTHAAETSTMENSWALGSQLWSRLPHNPNYNARYGILLDIVGAPGSVFNHEYYSTYFAPGVVRNVWEWAHKAGYSDYFVNEEGGAITDDHFYVNTTAGIPCIDIINCDPESPNGFGPYHHTMKDDMDWIDATTLKAVGQTVLTVIYNEK
jgi:hypothetical protein